MDPITVEVLRNTFCAIAEEMNANLARSAYTPIIYDMKDCSVGLFNEKVELVGQSPGLPILNVPAGMNSRTIPAFSWTICSAQPGWLL